MRKETRKEFVVCKDYEDEFVKLNKGDIAIILPIEFFDSSDSQYRQMLIDNELEPELHVDVSFYTLEEYKKILTTNGKFEEKYSTPVHVYDLPRMFNDLKLQPRNITSEFEE